MGAKLAVLMIHGMGEHEDDPDFAAKMVKRLRKRLGGRAGDVEFGSCWWAPVIAQYQRQVWERMTGSGKPLRARALRKFVVNYLGDPVMYLSGYLRGGNPAYEQVHECVRGSLATLAGALQKPDETPLMVIAHSLGATIISNYVWDQQAKDEPALPETTPFTRMETLTSFISYGSTIPVFLPPRRPLECIKFPPPMLRPEYRAVAAWENVYDPDDILGYPIDPVWDVKHGTVIDDIPIRAGFPLLSMTPLSHILYDKDDDFLDVVEDRMNVILNVPTPLLP